MLDDILLQVNKPGRYIGEEWNLPKKDFAKADIKFALCFPDLYEVGMSNLGMRIIYGLLNDMPEVICERFFSLAADMEDALRNNHLGIISLESKKSLGEFDMIGFSLGYELSYTNVLNILDLGAIPLESSLRDHTHPLVIGGGPCALNPEPLHEFFDLFVLGEAEEVILEIIDVYRQNKDKFKSGEMTKQELLVRFSRIEGVYAPSLYAVTYNCQGKIEKFEPKIAGVPTKIKKRFLKDLNDAYFPSRWLVPYISVIHDRPFMEIMRGCPNRCRFCQARSQYYPFRQRNLKNIMDLACDTYNRTGYEEISLGGLSVSDHSQIEELLRSLIGLFKEKAVGISLPSIKPKTVVGNISSLISTIRKTGLTFAPEAASERLHKILSKDFDVQSFFQAIEQAYAAGYQRVKLYFMICLPGESDTDLDGIIDFSARVSQARKNAAGSGSIKNKSPACVNISINTFIPKPHTPFQWLGMPGLEAIKYKQDYLEKRATGNKRLSLNFHNRFISLLEAVLSRGDRRLSRVILCAFRKGAKFDAWDNYFNWDLWQDAFRQSGVDFNFYLKERAQDEILPWDFLDIGINKEALITEADQANKLIAIE